MRGHDSVSIAVGCLLIGGLVAGCQRVPTQQGMLERDATDARLSSHQLRVMVNEFVIHFADRVELSADQILAQASDPAIRKSALLWKINGISAAFQAATRPDPLGAYLDVWILNQQMIHLMDSPAGGELFGPWQPIASGQCHAFEQRLQHINRIVGGNLRLGEEFVTTFAADFPLTSLYFDREPIASRYIEEVEEPEREMFQVLANLDENVDELKKLSVLYAAHLPKQARWEAELLLIDTMQMAFVQRPLHDFSLTADAVSRVAQVAESLPQLVERERHALQTIVADEREGTLRELDRMRQDTVVQLEGERAVVLAAIREEREAVVEAIREERKAVNRELHADVSQALQATDSISRRRVEELAQQAPQVIDHFFWRTWQLCLVFALAAIAVVWFVRRAKSRTAQALPKVGTPEPVDEQILSAQTHGPRARAA